MAKKKNPSITVFTDGGSINNGKKDPNLPVYGAFGIIILKDGEEIHRYTKTWRNVTNNQMELGGVISAIEWLDDNLDNGITYDVTIISDSQYVVSGYNEWLKGWIKKGWRNSEGNPTPNKEMWQLLISMINNCSNLNISFMKVKGHQGKNIELDDNELAYYNEQCDTILTEALADYRKRIKDKKKK